MNPYIIYGVVGVVALAILIFIGGAFSLWWQSVLSKAPVGLMAIVLMRFRKVNPTVIVTARITAKKAGIDIPSDLLEAHYMSGGRVSRVISALRKPAGNWIYSARMPSRRKRIVSASGLPVAAKWSPTTPLSAASATARPRDAGASSSLAPSSAVARPMPLPVSRNAPRTPR